MKAEIETNLKTARNYVSGKWIDPEHHSMLAVENPSTGEVFAQVPLSIETEANRAVDVAHEAFKSWSVVAASRRVQPLFKLAHLINENENRIARAIAEELGKSLPDSMAEVKRMHENCQAACGMPILQQGDKLIGAGGGIDGEVLHLPLGVFCMIAPFNFPGMVPFWFLPYALASGNTFVIKPSEQVPMTMQMVAELIDESGFPPGVFNLVNGDRVVGEAFMAHPKVVGVSIVGSSTTARHVASTCATNGKRFQALGGAKNHLVAMPDANIDAMIANMLTSCFGCAGQRCMASSVLVGVGEETYNLVTEKFVQAATEVRMGDPLDPQFANDPLVMGPVVSAKAKQRILDLIEQGVNEGANLLVDGRNLESPDRCSNGHFIAPTIFNEVTPNMTIHKTEIFGPVVCIMKADSIEEAIEIVNDHEYGNGASIYTQNGYHARKFKLEAQAGMIGINVGIPAPVAHLPFGGMKGSIFSDVKVQGKEVVNFYTEKKIITERYWDPSEI